jgi:hypothetical protein
VNGTTVSGYSVKISKAEEEQNLQQEIQSGALPQSVEPLMEQQLQKIGTPIIDVYIDSAKLLRQVSFTNSGGSSGATVKLVMAFDNFGTPVTIAAPASNDVITFSKFIQEVQALGESAGTNS